jgi:HEAT repeat protein
MSQLPPEDQPDVLRIGPVSPIPIIEDDDPRFVEERAAWSRATAKAQALHSADELLSGVRDPDWRVRFESVDRLTARWHGDPRTLLSILGLAEHDEEWRVRSTATMALCEFEIDHVVATVRRGLDDESEDVRWSSNFVLFQAGLSDSRT